MTDLAPYPQQLYPQVHGWLPLAGFFVNGWTNVLTRGSSFKVEGNDLQVVLHARPGDAQDIAAGLPDILPTNQQLTGTIVGGPGEGQSFVVEWRAVGSTRPDGELRVMSNWAHVRQATRVIVNSTIPRV